MLSIQGKVLLTAMAVLSSRLARASGAHGFKTRWFAARILCSAILLVASLVANQVMAASFDCKKASTATEKMICADSNLSSLDDDLQKGYRAASSALKPSEREGLLVEQRNWIKYVRNICTDGSCLGKVYDARISLLKRTEWAIADEGKCSIPSGHSCRSVVYLRDPSYRMASFNRSLVSNGRSARVIAL